MTDIFLHGFHFTLKKNLIKVKLIKKIYSKFQEFHFWSVTGIGYEKKKKMENIVLL